MRPEYVYELPDPDTWVCPFCKWDGDESRAPRVCNGPPLCPNCIICGEQVRLIRTPLAEMRPKGETP